MSVTAAFYLATHTAVGWVFGAGLLGLAVAWVVTTGLAFTAIRRGLLHQHQEWMIRSYVVTFGFVFFRIFAGIAQVTGIGTLQEQLAAASWFCWAHRSSSPKQSCRAGRSSRADRCVRLS